MVAKKSLKSQLNSIGLHFRIFGRGEVKELQRILRFGENIFQCAYGYYHGGSGLLVVTDQRIILLDKRTFYLNFEEFSYSKIYNIEISVRAMQATLKLSCDDKKLVFRSLSDARLRNMSKYINEAVRRFSESNMDVVGEQLNTVAPSVWRVNNSALVPRMRPTKFYGVSTQR
jgi:hypothetical protein